MVPTPEATMNEDRHQHEDASQQLATPAAAQGDRASSHALVARWGHHIRTQFAQYDEARDGVINLNEFAKALRETGLGNAATLAIIGNVIAAHERSTQTNMRNSGPRS